MGKYDDIIDLPHPVSEKHPHMSMYDRAAQFSPFDALTGYSESIDETARTTDRRLEKSPSGREDRRSEGALCQGALCALLRRRGRLFSEDNRDILCPGQRTSQKEQKDGRQFSQIYRNRKNSGYAAGLSGLRKRKRPGQAAVSDPSARYLRHLRRGLRRQKIKSGTRYSGCLLIMHYKFFISSRSAAGRNLSRRHRSFSSRNPLWP